MLLEGEKETLKERGGGRSRLLRTVMGRCMWRAVVLMVQQQEDQEGGNRGARAQLSASFLKYWTL